MSEKIALCIILVFGLILQSFSVISMVTGRMPYDAPLYIMCCILSPVMLLIFFL